MSGYPGGYYPSPPPPYSQPGYPAPSGYPGVPGSESNPYSYPSYPGTTPSYPGTAPSYPAYPNAGPRQYYMFRCRLNGLVLDIEGGNCAPGTHVVLTNQKPGIANKDSQLWFDDVSTGTIRNKLNEYVFDVGSDGCIILNPFYLGNVNQQWERSDLFIRNRVSPHRVFDVAGNNSKPGARIIAYDRHGNSNQLFDVQYVSADNKKKPPVPIPQYPAPTPRRLFYIVSEMNCKVLDIQGDNPTSGAKVIMWPKKNGRPMNQLWYFDSQGVIRSALNDFALEAQTDGAHVCMMPFSGSPHQRWTYSGNRIMKNQFECLDISGENRADGAKVISYRYKGSSNQHWRLEYV